MTRSLRSLYPPRYDPVLTRQLDERGRRPSGIDTDSYRNGDSILILIDLPLMGEIRPYRLVNRLLKFLPFFKDFNCFLPRDTFLCFSLQFY